MTYSTVEDIKTLIPERELINLTNDEAPADEVNEKRAEEAISYADEVINSYLRNKYVLPLTYIPKLITQISVDIAAFRLYSRRPQTSPEHIKLSYETAINQLKAIQKEQMILDLPNEHKTEDVTPPASMCATNKTKDSRIFSDDILKGFRF